MRSRPRRADVHARPLAVNNLPRAAVELCEVSEETVERTLFRGRGFRVGEFRCRPESPRWRQVNEIPPVAHVAFPHTSVVIQHLGRDPVLTNHNHVMFYNAGQQYRRMLHDPLGDRCIFVEIGSERLAELTGRDDETAFPFADGPSQPAVYLLQHQLARAAAEHEHSELLLLEESLVAALDESFGSALALYGQGRRCGRAATADSHRELAESAKAVLTENVAARLTLELLARRLYCSEFHLARVFRAHTGFSLHRYQTHLRLRLAVDRLTDPDIELSALASDLGFASHSHFTDTFRSTFGFSPSVVRRAPSRRMLRELRAVLDVEPRRAQVR